MDDELKQIRKQIDKIITKYIKRGDSSGCIYDFEKIDARLKELQDKIKK